MIFNKFVPLLKNCDAYFYVQLLDAHWERSMTAFYVLSHSLCFYIYIFFDSIQSLLQIIFSILYSFIQFKINVIYQSVVHSLSFTYEENRFSLRHNSWEEYFFFLLQLLLTGMQWEGITAQYFAIMSIGWSETHMYAASSSLEI